MKWVLILVLMIGLASAGTQICVDFDDPSAPSNLGVSGSVGSISLEWEAVIDEPSCSGIDEYVISRDGFEIGRVDWDVLEFVDVDFLGAGNYIYAVHAIDLVGRNAGASVANKIEISSGGGSGGGGSSSSYVCPEDWECGDWSDCVGNDMRRICEDLNKCGTVKDKPEVYRECGIDGGESSIEFNEIAPKETGFFSAITGAVIGGGATSIGIGIGFLVIVVGAFALVKYKKK